MAHRNVRTTPAGLQRQWVSAKRSIEDGKNRSQVLQAQFLAGRFLHAYRRLDDNDSRSARYGYGSSEVSQQRHAGAMTTRLDGTLKREIAIGDEPYTLTLTGEGFVLARKGRRKGLEIRWLDLVSGEAALATALNASLTAPTLPRPAKEKAGAGRK
jgi:hypothetical protein